MSITDSKGDNFIAVKNSISKIRKLLLNNFTAFEGFLITLTYDKPVMDFNIATKDFIKFFNRLKYHYSNYKFEYLRIIEPHDNGTWHIHVIVKSGIENQQIRFNQDDITKVWSGGSIKISQITDVVGLARYFGTCHNERYNEGGMSKTMQKQSRWHYYPANAKIFTKSKGIKYPKKIDMPFLQTRKILYDYVLSSEPTTYEIMSDDEKLVNVVSYENYRKK